MTRSQCENFTTGASGLKVIIAVPARLGSTRLPRKPLALLAGQPLIVHVARKVLECADQLSKELKLESQSVITVVATDSLEIQKTLLDTGMQAVITDSELPSGTDRIEAAVRQLEAQRGGFHDSTIVINLQGDEPFFCIEDIIRLVRAMQDSTDVPMGTLCYAQNSAEHFLRSSVVKVTRDHNRHALCFSRAPLPWPRHMWGASEPIPALSEKMAAAENISFLQHVGVYAYRRAALKKFTEMPPSSLEICEGLEQLRALEAGWKIIVENARDTPFGIDTPDDLQRAEKHFAQLGRPQ